MITRHLLSLKAGGRQFENIWYIRQESCMAIVITKITPEFVDQRGEISRLIDQEEYPIRAVLWITQKKGTTRGNHYHKKDAHWVYCVSGKFRYSEKNSRDPDAKVESVVLKPGNLVLSKPGIIHSMEALEDTIFLAITPERRDQEQYEGDTVRIKIV